MIKAHKENRRRRMIIKARAVKKTKNKMAAKTKKNKKRRKRSNLKMRSKRNKIVV